MKCTDCGTELANDAAFCHKCGKKLGAAQPTSDAPRTKSGNGNEPEETLWSGNYAPRAMFGSWLLALLASIGLGVAAAMMPAAVLGVAVVLALWWGLLIFLLFYRKVSVHYTLTNQRFTHRRGILIQTTDRIEAIDMDDVRVKQSLLERMLNVGTITIISSDQTDPVLNLTGIANVAEVAEMIDNVRRKERRRRGLHIEQI